jgi:hypothetical protein
MTKIQATLDLLKDRVAIWKESVLLEIDKPEFNWLEL